jgi:hypothetical protein
MDEDRGRQVGEAWKEAAYILAAFAVAVLGYLAWRFIFYRADFTRAARQVKASYMQGDVVAIFPSWLREEVFDFNDMAVIAPKEGTYVNFHGFSRLWTVTNTKYTQDRFQLKNEVRLIKESIEGNISIRLYSLPSFNATGIFEDAGVFVTEVGQKKPCRKTDGSKWMCGEQHWQFAGPLKVDVSGTSSECIWAHPMAGRPVEIEFPTSASYSNFQIYTAFTDSGAGGGPVPPVRLEVLQDGRTIREIVHPQREGWARASARFNSVAGRPIIARVTTEQEGRQHWCFNIEAE